MARPKSTGSQAETPPLTTRRADKAHRRELHGPDPIVRIGVMEEYDRIAFELQGAYDIIDLNGKPINPKPESGIKWHIIPTETTEARAVFSILTTAFARRDSADDLRHELAAQNHPARIAEVGQEISIDGKVIANNIKYRVLIGRWPTEREAKKYLEAFQDNFAPRIVRQIVKPTTGTVELFNDDATVRIDVSDGIRLIPKNDKSNVKLFAVREGTGFHWEREVDRTYPGTIEIRLDHRALLMAIVEVPLEMYLKGVVPAEMPASYPTEALKAQAIAARSELLAKIGMKHLNDPFDLCGTVHCQAYTGNSHIDERASKAVEHTRGQVLMMHNRVAEAVFSSSCGGHTENKVNVWNPPDAPHLQGYWDTPNEKAVEDKLDLTRERDTEHWVGIMPEVWCNTEAFDSLPDILKNARKYFRWEVKYTHRELEDIIRRKSGEDIGKLIDIIPLRRGLSGRLMEIEIQGTKKNLRIQRELNIRHILSPSYLYSACFTIDVDYGEDGSPINFYLKGAGWGHGVGMCQVGAGVMASQGKKAEEILKHYYPGTVVKKVYGD